MKRFSLSSFAFWSVLTLLFLIPFVHSRSHSSFQLLELFSQNFMISFGLCTVALLKPSSFTFSLLILSRLWNVTLLRCILFFSSCHSQFYVFILYMVKKRELFSKVYKIKQLTDFKSEPTEMKIIFESDIPQWVFCLSTGILNLVFFYLVLWPITSLSSVSCCKRSHFKASPAVYAQ